MPEPECYIIYVPLSAVFPNVEANFKTLRSLLQGLSRTDTLVWCARLNRALSDHTTESIKRQQFCIKRFLSPDEIMRVSAFAQEQGSMANQVIVFSRGQLLELMRWAALYCQDLPGDGETFNDPEVRRKFSQAALICSDILDRAIWGKGCVDDTTSLFLQGNAPGLSRKAVEATATVDLPECLGRGWTLFRDYLPKHYPSLYEDFQRSTGLSMEQYFACLSMVLAGSARPADTAGFAYDTVLRHTPYNDVFRKYMALESQTPEELRDRLFRQLPENLDSMEDAPPYNKRPLLDRPILRNDGGLAIIIDPIFFGESAAAGPLFHVLRDNPTKAQDLFSAFGHAFEDYVNDILRRMLPTSAILANRLLTNEKIIECGGAKLELDACINDVLTVVLIETKGVWNEEKTVLTDDPAAHMAHLRSKYIEDKGISQLARMVAALSDPRQSKANDKFAGATLIYPMMVVHDRFIPASFVGPFLQSEFERRLKPDEVFKSKRMKKGHLTVTPPVVVDIETLEGLETSIKHHAFSDLVDDYLRDCPDGKTSFGNFIASSPKYEQYFKPRLSVRTKAIEALKATAQQVFPEADPSQL